MRYVLLTEADMPKNEMIFGWGAPPMKEQHPCLSDELCIHFDKDNDAIIRLSTRGVLPRSQADGCRKRLVRQIEKQIRNALAKAGDES